MAENNNLPNEIVYSEKIDYDIKKQILDAINTSKNILSDIKENDPDWEKYEEALRDYNILKNEIQKVYLDDQNITKEELSWLKDEIASMEKYDERGTFQKTVDSVANYTNLTNTYETLDENKSILYDTLNNVQTSIKEINNNDAEYFFENPDTIKLIDNSEKLDEVLTLIINSGKKLEAVNINEKLFNEFVLKPWINLNYYNYQFISKENLETNLDSLVKLYDNISMQEFILLEACNKWVDKEIIKNTIKENNINVQFLKYINIYIWETEVMSEENFQELYENNSIEEINKLPIEEKTKIIEFISKNINNEKYTDIIIDFIKNTPFHGDLVILNITSVPILKAFINIDINNIRNITNEKINDRKIIDCFLENLQNSDKDGNIVDSEDILWNMDHINKSVDNIDSTLHIFNYIKNNIPEKYNEVKEMISDEEYIWNYIELFSKAKNVEIKPEYHEVYWDISKIVSNDLEKILALKSASNEFNVKNKNMTKDEYMIFSWNLYEKLDWLDETVKNNILKEIWSIDWKFTNDNTENIYNILKNHYPDYNTNPEFDKYYHIIHNEIKSFNNEKMDKIEKWMWWWGKEKPWEWWGWIKNENYKTVDENWIIKLNREKLWEDYAKLIKWKSEAEKIKIREKFINDNFEILTDDDKKGINEILDRIIINHSITYTQENFEDFKGYMAAKEANPDSKVEFKEYMEIKPKLDDPTNNFFISKTEDYSPVGWWFSLKWKNWETIDWLVITEEEKALTLWNPEATENLINFYTFFEELNLEWVWKYRKELITAIWDVTIDPNDGDSIKSEELRKFWNNILTFISKVDSENWEWDFEQASFTDINTVNNTLKDFSWAWSMASDSKTFNIEWEDRFTAYLRSEWIIWWAYFQINKFREYLK